ncbi:MAG: ABC transporter ATP-binding protein [Actinomycetota bacterium]|nr:ABC transporter ATP-binding protein [Actinomycetota bacterium]
MLPPCFGRKWRDEIACANLAARPRAETHNPILETTVPVVAVADLTKNYDDVAALRGIDFTIDEGEVFALLGPNGAGKTTAVEILEGYRRPTSGTVSVLGFDPARHERAYMERIGIVLQETSVERELSVREVLDVYGGVYPKRVPTGELIELVGLEDKADARVKTLSGGQKRRLEVALGIAGDPELVFLDEPTTGFDPTARRQAWMMIENLTNLGKTILLTTHYMDEAQNLADRVAVINQGRIVAEGTPDTLGGRHTAASVIRFSVPAVGLSELPFPRTRIRSGVVEVDSDEPTRDLHGLTSWALDRDIELGGLTVTQPTLEDVYLELIAEET